MYILCAYGSAYTGSDNYKMYVTLKVWSTPLFSIQKTSVGFRGAEILLDEVIMKMKILNAKFYCKM